MNKDEAWEMIDSALDHSYSEKDVIEIKEAFTQPAQEPLTEVQIQSGLMALLRCSASDLDNYSYIMIDHYTEDVKRVVSAITQNYLEKDNSQSTQTLVGKWTGKEIEWTENPYKFKQGQNFYVTSQERSWVDLTPAQYEEIWRMDLNNEDLMDRTIAKLKELNK